MHPSPLIYECVSMINAAMEFLGIDLAQLAESNKNLLTPEGVLKDCPLEFLAKQIPILKPAPDVQICKGYYSSWIGDLTELVLDVWKQPWTQLMGIGVVVTGVTVCSWKLSRYWADDFVPSCKRQRRKLQPQSKGVDMRETSAISVVPASGSVVCDWALERQISGNEFLNVSLPTNMKRERFDNRLGKVIWRVRDIVQDLNDLDNQRETLQEEIRVHQETCSKLEELGNLERSKRFAAEDKMKLIETENLRLKQLNQIIAKKASLIDRLEFIIQEKNAIDSAVPMISPALVQQRQEVMPPVQNDRRLLCVEGSGVTGQLQHDAKHPGDVDAGRDIKIASSRSTFSGKADKSSSVVVLSEDDNQERLQGTSLQWHYPIPREAKTPSLRLQSITTTTTTTTTNSLTNVTKRTNKKRKRRSSSHHEASRTASSSTKTPGWNNVKSKANADILAKPYSQKSPNAHIVEEEEEEEEEEGEDTSIEVMRQGSLESGIDGREDVTLNADGDTNVLGKTGYDLLSPPKCHQTWKEGSDDRHSFSTLDCNPVSGDSIEARCSEMLTGGARYRNAGNKRGASIPSPRSREGAVDAREKDKKSSPKPNEGTSTIPGKGDVVPTQSDEEAATELQNIPSIPESENNFVLHSHAGPPPPPLPPVKPIDEEAPCVQHETVRLSPECMAVASGVEYAKGEDVQKSPLNLVTVGRSTASASVEPSISERGDETPESLVKSVPEESEEKLEMVCCHGSPVNPQSSFFPGIKNVLKKKFSSKKEDQPSKGQFQAVRFINNKGVSKNVCCDEDEGNVNQSKKTEESWVVVTNNINNNNSYYPKTGSLYIIF